MAVFEMVRKEKKKSDRHYNHLKDEKSPYLIQHAQNPVDWYPWGEEAFGKAKRENKPLFLSIGYSTCHWCHVMARESFQDPEMARLINQVFVPVKVDREERPDIDATYMAVCQIMTGTGGWPLTIFLTPDLKPFFAGTYFPKENSEMSIGLKTLVLNVQDLWKMRKEEVLKSADDITNALNKLETTESGDFLPESILKVAFNFLEKNFSKNGGFGESQKFPQHNYLLFLLRYWKRTGNDNALFMVEKTLQSMRMGGIWDHLGFGFHRYSVDPQWLVPHFEKMLYDQALLALVYCEAHQATRKEEYREVTEQILKYVLRDMTSPEGGFYSAEDAESEGIEGNFYQWKKEEIDRILTPEESQIFNKLYQVKDKGNYTDEATGLFTGRNILHLKTPPEATARNMNLEVEEISAKLEIIREKLFQARENRIHPSRDDKILTDWNGLMLAALARAGRTFNEKQYIEAARKTVEFVKNNLYRDGILWHRYREGEVKIKGYLDDYAFLIWGIIELYQATLDSSFLKWAYQLVQELLDKFQDKDEGGFYLTSSDSQELLLRRKEAYDASIPSANAVTFINLLHLSALLEDQELYEPALKLERAFAPSITQNPTGYTIFLTGLMDRLGPLYEVVIVGEKEDKQTQNLIKALNQNYLPGVIYSLNSSEEVWLSEKIPSFQDKKPLDGQPTAYVCKQGTCMLPTTDVRELMDLLLK